jgi:hypothetical protein
VSAAQRAPERLVALAERLAEAVERRDRLFDSTIRPPRCMPASSAPEPG